MSGHENPCFSKEAMNEFEDICSRYPNKMAPLLMVLHLAEREFDWLSEAVQDYVAGLLNLPPSHVRGVVTFYTMYKRSRKGRHRIQFCSTLSCAIRGSEEIFDHLCRRLGLARQGGLSDDALVSVEKVECLGACDRAPMMLDNDETHGELSPEKIDALLESWGVHLKGFDSEVSHA
jgi:NADH-quinone oxidoreductase subunit E